MARETIREVKTSSDVEEHLQKFVETGDTREIDEVISSVEVETKVVKVSREEKKKVKEDE